MDPVNHLSKTIAANPVLNVAVREEIAALEKAELHLHLGGSWPRRYLEEIANDRQKAALGEYLEKLSGKVDYHSAFGIFPLIGEIVNSVEKVEEGTAALCRELADDGVVYAEFRTGLKDLGGGFESYLKAVMNGMARSSAIETKLILSLRRNTPAEDAEKTIDFVLKHREEIVGIDISGDSTIGDGSQLYRALLRAKEGGVPIVLHMGESPKESAEQQMRELRELQPARVGHAVHLCEEAKEWIKKQKVPVELCLTSAHTCQMIEEPYNHPALQLLREGHPVSVCTDDPLLFSRSLTDELTEVAEQLSLSLEQVKEQQKKTLGMRL